MSEAKKQVLIVSLYDRGFYLSNELAEQGHQVTLLNLPYKNNSADFWSNPFGFLKNDNLTYNQKYFLDGPSTHQAENGLSLWLNDGPVDFKTHFSKQILESRGATNNWIEPFSKSLFSTISNIDKFSHSDGGASDLSLDYSVKNSNLESIQYELKNTERLGVKVINDNLVSIVRTGDKKTQVQIGNETLEFDKVVCLLSSYECSVLNEELLSYVYNGNTLSPEWVWLSASFAFEPSVALEQMPEHFVVLEDIDYVWAYKNLLFVRKNTKTSCLEVNFRWPFNERTNISYINSELNEIEEFFKNKIKDIKLTLKPLVSEDLSPFYVYNAEELNQFNNQLKKSKNIIQFGPEAWKSWDLLNVMKSQYNLTQEERLSHD